MPLYGWSYCSDQKVATTLRFSTIYIYIFDVPVKHRVFAYWRNLMRDQTTIKTITTTSTHHIQFVASDRIAPTTKHIGHTISIHLCTKYVWIYIHTNIYAACINQIIVTFGGVALRTQTYTYATNAQMFTAHIFMRIQWMALNCAALWWEATDARCTHIICTYIYRAG